MNVSCRICLFKIDSTNCSSIFTKSDTNEVIANMIADFASVKVCENDTLPKMICACCCQKLYDSYKFKKLIVNSDSYLRQEQKDYKDVKNMIENEKYDHNVVDLQSKMENDNSQDQQFNINVDELILKEEVCEPENSKQDVNGTDSKVKCPTESKRVPPKKRQFICVTCNETFRSHYSLAVHEVSHTGVTRFSCELCNKYFPAKWALNVHRKKHSEARSYKCEFCEKTFKFPTGLTIHRKTHQGVKFECETCAKTFPLYTNLKAHEQVHFKEKTFICEFCSKSHQTNTSLIKHLAIHKKPVMVSCPVCNKEYVKSRFKKHLDTHSGEKPVTCEVCKKKFGKRTNMKVHMRIHEGIKPHLCKICGKSFTHGSTLTNHMRIHSGETPYSCTVCDRRFSYSHHLGNHIKKEHSDLVLDDNKN